MGIRATLMSETFYDDGFSLGLLLYGSLVVKGKSLWDNDNLLMHLNSNFP